jgi:hypothetical protein
MSDTELRLLWRAERAERMADELRAALSALIRDAEKSSSRRAARNRNVIAMARLAQERAGMEELA